MSLTMNQLRKFITEGLQPHVSEFANGATVILPDGKELVIKTQLQSRVQTWCQMTHTDGQIYWTTTQSKPKPDLVVQMYYAGHSMKPFIMLYFLSGDRNKMDDLIHYQQQVLHRTVYDITDAIIKENPKPSNGSAIGFKKLELTLYVISTLGKEATISNVLKRVAELEGKPYRPGNKSYFEKGGPIDAYIVRSEEGRPKNLILNEEGQKIASQVAAKLAQVSAKSVQPVDFSRYIRTSKQVVTFVKAKLYILEPGAKLHLSFEPNGMVYPSINAKSITVPAGSIFSTHVENGILLYLISGDGVRLTTPMKVKAESFLVPVDVPDHIRKQAEERSVYLDAVQEAGLVPSENELLKLQTFLTANG